MKTACQACVGLLLTRWKSSTLYKHKACTEQHGTKERTTEIAVGFGSYKTERHGPDRPIVSPNI